AVGRAIAIRSEPSALRTLAGLFLFVAGTLRVPCHSDGTQSVPTTAMRNIEIYDTTLRDGAQGEGVSFSLLDKLQITQRLAELGFDYVEGGYPLSNEKDADYFQRVQEMSLGREVIYDAEHFFDGWKLDGAYAAQTILAAAEGGAKLVVLCDTNGGSLPEEVAELTRAAVRALEPRGVPVGIHCHNDCELAVA